MQKDGLKPETSVETFAIKEERKNNLFINQKQVQWDNADLSLTAKKLDLKMPTPWNLDDNNNYEQPLPSISINSPERIVVINQLGTPKNKSNDFKMPYKKVSPLETDPDLERDSLSDSDESFVNNKVTFDNKKPMLQTQ